MRPFRDTSTDDLETEVSELSSELDALRREPRHFREVAHEAVDASVATAQQRLDLLLSESVRRLATGGGDPILPQGVGDLWVLASVPQIAAAWHRVVDAAPAGHYGPVAERSRADYEARRDELEQAIAERERELQVREAEEAKAEADRRLASLEV